MFCMHTGRGISTTLYFVQLPLDKFIIKVKAQYQFNLKVHCAFVTLVNCKTVELHTIFCVCGYHINLKVPSTGISVVDFKSER